MALIDEKGKGVWLSLPKEIRGEIETGGARITATYPAKRIGSSYVLPTITSDWGKAMVVKSGGKNSVRVLSVKREEELFIIESEKSEMVLKERGMGMVALLPRREKRGTDGGVKPLFYDTDAPTLLLPVCVVEDLVDKPIVIHEDSGGKGKILSFSETFRYETEKGEIPVSAAREFESHFYDFLESEGIDKNDVRRHVFGGNEFLFVVNAVERRGLYSTCFDANNGDLLFGEWMKREKGAKVPFLENLRFDKIVEKSGRLFVSFSGYTQNRNRCSVYSIYEESKKVRGKRTFVSRTVVENPTGLLTGISQNASFFYHVRRSTRYAGERGKKVYRITIYEPRSKRTLVKSVPASRERNGFLAVPANPKDGESIFFLSGYYGEEGRIAVETVGTNPSSGGDRRAMVNLDDLAVKFDTETESFASDGILYAMAYTRESSIPVYIPIPVDAENGTIDVSGDDLLYPSSVPVIDVRQRKIVERVSILKNKKKRLAFDGNMANIALPWTFMGSDEAYLLRLSGGRGKIVLVGVKERDGETGFSVYEKEGNGDFRPIFDEIFKGTLHYSKWVPMENGVSVSFATGEKNGREIKSVMGVAITHETAKTKIFHFTEKEMETAKKALMDIGLRLGPPYYREYRTRLVESVLQMDNAFFLSNFLENTRIERTVGMESKEPESTRER